MINKSFIFLDKIGIKSELNIWNQGIKDWNVFLNRDKIKGISPKKKVFCNNLIIKAKSALFNYDSSFFLSFPSTETWRLFDFFKDDVVYLDLEMDGKREITVLTLYDGFETKTFIRNMTLFKENIENELKRYKLIVTFNGSSFDLPIIKKYFGNIIPDVPHIDLRHCCNRIKLSGGLKKIEKRLNISRPKNLVGDKDNPIWLWKAFNASGNEDWLNLLVEYNQEDAINLKPLMVFCYKELKKKLLC